MNTASAIRPVRHRARPVPCPPAEVSPPVAAANDTADDPDDDGAAGLAAQSIADYDVGYGKPPKQHRFKPGTSGNPKGRPKGARGAGATIRKALEQKVKIRLDGKVTKVTSFEAILYKMREQALQGDARVLHKLVQLYQSVSPDEAPPPLAELPVEERSATDDAILARFRASILADAADPDSHADKEDGR